MGVAEWVLAPQDEQQDLFCSHLEGVKGLLCQRPGAEALSFALGRASLSERPVLLFGGLGLLSDSQRVLEIAQQRRRCLIFLLPESVEAIAQAHPELEAAIDLEGLMEEELALSIAQGKPIFLSLPPAELRLAEPLPSRYPAPEGAVTQPFRSSLSDLSQLLHHRYHEGIVLALGRLDAQEQEPALWLVETLRVPTLAEAGSGLREELAGLRLCSPQILLNQAMPYHLIRVGDFDQSDSELWEQVEQHGRSECYHITRCEIEGKHCIVGEIELIMKALGDVPYIGDVQDLLPASRQQEARIEEHCCRYPESRAAMLRTLSQYATLMDSITLISSGVQREWNENAQLCIPCHNIQAWEESGEGFDALAAYAADASAASCCMLDAASLLASKMPVCAGSAGKRLLIVLHQECNELREKALQMGWDYCVMSSMDDLDALDEFMEAEGGSRCLLLHGLVE